MPLKSYFIAVESLIRNDWSVQLPVHLPILVKDPLLRTHIGAEEHGCKWGPVVGTFNKDRNELCIRYNYSETALIRGRKWERIV